MPGVNKKPTSKSFNAVTPPSTRGTLDLHHSKYNDTKLTRKSVTYVVELKCYPCEWRAPGIVPPHTFSFVLTYFRGTSELDDGTGTEALQTVPHFFLKISRSGLTRAMPRVKLSGKSVQQLCCACQ